MKRKIFIGSIIAVTVLIGLSFTSVVGYRSITSNVKASPLFNIRSSRAIDEESETFSCKFFGSGDDFNILIPNRNDEIKLIHEVIDRLQTMDEETFNRFSKSVFARLNQKIIDKEEVVDDLEKVIENTKINQLSSVLVGNWEFGCWIYFIFWTIINILRWTLPSVFINCLP